MKESPLSEISPRPRHSTQPHFLPFLALTPRHLVFFSNIQHSQLYSLCQLIVKWVLMDSDGCIMNMHAIEIQSCCCLEALYASLNVLLHILKHRDQGTLIFLFFLISCFMERQWCNSCGTEVETQRKREKRRAGILKWSRFTYHANFMLTIKHLQQHALKGQTVTSFFIWI